MNKKLSLIILFLLFISLISVLLAFMAFSHQNSNEDVGELKTGYEQLSKQVNELKVTTKELDTKVGDGTPVSTPATTTQAANTPVTNTPATNTPVTTPPTTAVTTKTVVSESVNMRSGPSTNGKVVRQLPKGEQVTPTGITASSAGFQWIQVKDSKGNQGWVVSTYIK
ncbi:SH3 domain-containing protein [Priestia aryabhattai]|uniref:SH3 domain-containing protein n=1 Tax=Priestia aryabhattai TaxID=412384 RepID=A0AAX6NCZ0_PRIAR|nr:SH3 domain-containing protein [Priestia aryabhattai]MDU9693657.1 SH3 domain-containing protein [Priestia aryabhattai]NGY89118.1 SH3 domain-containing protein [Priestia megaterium]